MEKITAIRGFKDILPDDALAFCRIESLARTIFDSFGFREIRVPILEKTELFKRSIGETTDIVEKEMYTFTDRDNDQITLRPEATASVIRAYIEHNMSANESVTKLFTFGPMFRRERPQKGRFRQFNQIDVEVFGDDKPQTDADVIFMLMHFLNSAGLRNLQLEINSLGLQRLPSRIFQGGDRFPEGQAKPSVPGLSAAHSHQSPAGLRLQGSSCAETLAGAPQIIDFLCSDCTQHFAQVQSFLADLQTPFVINARMVRGLDYYTRTAFEVTTGILGAQNAVAGGGRYNGLVSFLGGPDVTGIGFAVGFERLVACLPENRKDTYTTDLFIAALGANAQHIAFGLTNRLRVCGLSAEMDYSDKSLKSQMKRADKLNSAYALIFGDKEIEEKQVVLRNMQTKQQQDIPMMACMNP
jgi:histidyl-tRNA synthetase